MAEATYDGLKKHDNRRPFVITRASYSGTQKYSTAWTGDNQSLWAHLQMSIPQLSNMGLSGLIFVGTDVGGFGSDTTKELLIRWVQAGLFAPLFRNHSSMGTRSQEPWAFDDETTNIYRKYLNLRYEVIPYLYDLFFVHQTTGAPIMRPLVYHYQDDVLTHNINDEYLVGENLLVAPVVEQGKTKKLVYLPKGKWVDYNTLDIYEGGTYVIIDAPLDVLPMFVKFNSMLVKYEAKNNIDPNDRTNLIVELYGNSATYSHYLDDGESFKYLEGEYQIYNFEYSNGEFKVELQKEYAKNYKSIEVRHRNKVVLIEGNKNTNIKI
jgi:alpha-glucosidase